ncbi:MULTISPECIES: trypsin-like serine protease [unclassified Streptomyces]|uniref:trypsin-like serine peptidase n=1 Tax=unclassified Streptomyces TaxID=2593676 RepID=UPI0034009AA5
MRVLRTVGRVTAAGMLALVTGCGGSAVSAPQQDRPDEAPPAPAPQSSATATAGLPFVGVLVDGDKHWCTAAVVAGPRGNVVATAAHCADAGSAGSMEFAPGFSGAGKGSFPYGTWKVKAVQTDARWSDDGDDSVDYAFLTLEPDARGRSVQSVVGAAQPDWGSGPRRRVTVVGYPDEDHNPENRPIACTTDTRPDPDLASDVRIDCAGFWTGTSGSPWLADHRGPDRPGRLIGVLSGGDTDVASTAVLFDARARRLYEKAARA